MLKPGDTVKVYLDPVTCSKLEGRAKLVREISPDTGSGFSRWIVQFEGEWKHGLEEPEVPRTINIENC